MHAPARPEPLRRRPRPRPPLAPLVAPALALTGAAAARYATTTLGWSLEEVALAGILAAVLAGAAVLAAVLREAAR